MVKRFSEFLFLLCATCIAVAILREQWHVIPGWATAALAWLMVRHQSATISETIAILEEINALRKLPDNENSDD